MPVFYASILSKSSDDAKHSFDERNRWGQMIEEYFQSERDIRLVVQLIDMRHKPTEDDMQMLDFLSQVGMPYVVALTKSDKLNKAEYNECLSMHKDTITPFGPIAIIPFSSVKGEGADEVKGFILDAEAEKQAAILRAEAKKEAMIREAEGEAEAIMKVQQANADGIRFLKDAGADQAVLTIKSLEAFEKAADGKATKIIIPSEIQGMAGLVKSLTEVGAKDDNPN